jgi:hypothetical protein
MCHSLSACRWQICSDSSQEGAYRSTCELHHTQENITVKRRMPHSQLLLRDKCQLHMKIATRNVLIKTQDRLAELPTRRQRVEVTYRLWLERLLRQHNTRPTSSTVYGVIAPAAYPSVGPELEMVQTVPYFSLATSVRNCSAGVSRAAELSFAL